MATAKQELKEIINIIKTSRKKGYRDDFIINKLLDDGITEEMIANAMDSIINNKRKDKSKVVHTIILEKRVVDAYERKAKKDNLTLNMEFNKILIENFFPEGPPKGVFINRRLRKVLYKGAKGKE